MKLPVPSKAQWKAVATWLSMTSNVAVILTMFLLDVRDLNYKIAWIGPSESFSFLTGSTSILQPEPLRVSAARDIRLHNASSQPIQAMDSGWPSFLARCEQLHAMSAHGSSFFLSAMGKNCTLGGDAHASIPRLIMTSDQRVDTVVWASCVLLHISRRPPICYEAIVSEFYGRYMLQESSLPSLVVAEKGSPAEQELLRFLEIVSDSVPHHRVICVEAFPMERDTDVHEYEPTVFGCGSPNSFRSEFVGMLNPSIVDLLREKAWLTADSVSIMGSRFLIRQNCMSRYKVFEQGTTNGDVVLQSHTMTNFSSFGQLYVLVILIDLTLLLLNSLSSLELVGWMSFPKYSDVKTWVEQKERRQQGTSSSVLRLRTPSISALLSTPASGAVAPKPLPRASRRIQRSRRLLASMEAMGGTAGIEEEQLYSFFSRSLYRNPRVAMTTVVTQLMSWLVIQPNAVVWTWSESSHAKLQAYLSSIRCWVLALILCNWLWAGVTRISERAAYSITKRTFLTSIDVVCIVSLVSFAQRHSVFAMSEAKWTLEKQRVNDITSFDGGFLAHGNTFNVALDSVHTTPWAVIVIVYGPLVQILLTSIAAIAALLTVKAFYFSRQRRLVVQRLKRSMSRLSNRLSSMDRHPKRMDSGFNEDEESEQMQTLKAFEDALSRPYHRLPLEDWLDQPIRATSLVRNGLRMETIRDHTRLIRPSCYLDFGIIVKRGVIHSRMGFSGALRVTMSVQEYMARIEGHASQVEALKGSVGDGIGVNIHGGASSPTIQPLRSASAQGLNRKQSLHVPLS